MIEKTLILKPVLRMNTASIMEWMKNMSLSNSKRVLNHITSRTENVKLKSKIIPVTGREGP
jgi:hypothetical protein